MTELVQTLIENMIEGGNPISLLEASLNGNKTKFPVIFIHVLDNNSIKRFICLMPNFKNLSKERKTMFKSICQMLDEHEKRELLQEYNYMKYSDVVELLEKLRKEGNDYMII